MKYFNTITILKEGSIEDFGTYESLVSKNSKALDYLKSN